MAKKEKNKKKRSKKITIKRKVFPKEAKGRKGEYFYVKSEGKKGKYYKKKKGVKIKNVKEYYSRDITSKRGGISVKRIEKERRLDKIARIYPKIEDTLRAGYAEHTIESAEKLTPAGIRSAYQYLLLNKGRAGDGKGIVRDKELLELLTRGENIEKWKHRVLFEVQIRNEKGEIMATIMNTQTKHLGELKREVLDEIKTGETYSFTGIGSPGATTYKSGIMQTITNRGYRVNVGTSPNGKAHDIKVKLIFRKGK